MAPLEKITTPDRESLANSLSISRREIEILTDKNRNLRQTVESYAEENERLRDTLTKVRQQLNRWADESREGGWSTHQVEPQRELAAKIQQSLDR